MTYHTPERLASEVRTLAVLSLVGGLLALYRIGFTQPYEGDLYYAAAMLAFAVGLWFQVRWIMGLAILALIWLAVNCAILCLERGPHWLFAGGLFLGGYYTYVLARRLLGLAVEPRGASTSPGD